MLVFSVLLQLSPTKKNCKINVENAFSQPELFRVINIKCFSGLCQTSSDAENFAKLFA